VADALEAADDETVVLVVSNCGTRSGRQRLRRPAAPAERAAVEWRRRFGAFFAWGKGVRPGRVVGAKSEDIVPTVLGLAGLPLAEDMPGRFLSEVFETRAPEATVSSYEKGRPAAIRKALHGDAEGIYAVEDPLSRIFPGSVLVLQSHLNRGLYYLRVQNHNEARWHLLLARQQDPESVRALYSSAFLSEGRDRLLLAETGYREAIRIDTGFTAAHLRLALVLRKTGRRDEALARARHVAAIEPALSEARMLLGVFLLDAGRSREAEAELSKAVELEPDFLEARNRLGIHLLDQGRFAEAATHFQAAVDLDPRYLKAWNNLGVSLLRHAAQIRDDPRSREEILDRALRTFDLTIERFPGYPKPFYNRARLRLIRGQRDLAARDAAMALELDPDYPDARRLQQFLEGGRAPPR
jgi:tetratricopeptide (TPR) repeat protein